MRKLAAALLLLVAGAAQAEVLTFDKAEWATPLERHFMGPNFREDRLTWAPISLPHNWWLQPPPIGHYAWYRIRFSLERAPEDGQSLYIPRLRFKHGTVYVNQQPVWKLYEAYAAGVQVTGLLIRIPAGLLRTGENSIHVEAIANPQWFQGVSRIDFGPTVMLSQRAADLKLMQEQIIHICAAAFGAIGLLSLWLWFRVERDPVLFWYGVSGVTLLAATILWHVSLWRPDFSGWRDGLLFMHYHGYLAPFFILHLRLAGRRHVLVESALWLVLLAAFITISQLNPTAWLAWGLAFATLPALLIVPLLMTPGLGTKPAVLVLIVADLAASFLPLHDWATRLGILEFDRPYLVVFAPAFVMLAAAVPIIDRVQASKRATAQQRLELERRVAEKTREIESSHERLRRAQREQALAEERRRIMADMHDGLGARLVGLLSIAQSGKDGHGEIGEGIAAALDELRLAVDSVQPVEGDVGVVLGNVRHRMRSVFERSGVQLAWNVSELPRIDDLTPERILAVQRVFLETFSNAIRHSGACSVSVFTMRVPGAVRIVIEDDGRGFDPAGAHAGRGLGNLHMRAKQAGGALQVDSQAGKGTRVTLTLPLADGQQPDLPGTGEENAPPPVRGISL